ncbi:MFS transporter [Cellulomonas telluris]|uniref:MFS transporter n=1 Tax=Cellulomonas telluris TaxID=2306636 RepID=UPI0010A8D195|nr:MFS transporter [Cellulomonas telluris]
MSGTTGRAAAGTAPRGVLAVTVTLCLVQLVDVLGVTVVVTTLPSMLRDLGASAGEGTFVVTAYAMFFGGLLLVAARLGDRLGHRRVLLAAIVLFGLASVLGAVAGGVALLTAARALQGVAAAASVPAALRLLTTLVPEGRWRRRAVAAWSAAGAAAGAAGFVVGGAVTEVATWRAVFWLTLALAAGLLVAVRVAVPADTARQAEVRVPWVSAVLLTAGAMGLVAGPTLLAETGAVVAGSLVLAAGAAATVGFVAAERAARDPLVAREARGSSRLRWGTLGSFANTATTSSSATVATLHLQDELGLTPLAAAAALVSVSVLAVVGSALAPRVIARLTWRRTMGAGLLLVAGANAVLVASATPAAVALTAALSGLGLGASSVAANDMGTSVDEHLRATAAGVLNTAAQLGTALGTAAVLLVASATSARVGWAVVAGLAAVAAAACARRRSPAAEPAAV